MVGGIHYHQWPRAAEGLRKTLREPRLGKIMKKQYLMCKYDDGGAH